MVRMLSKKQRDHDANRGLTGDLSPMREEGAMWVYGFNTGVNASPNIPGPPSY